MITKRYGGLRISTAKTNRVNPLRLDSPFPVLQISSGYPKYRSIGHSCDIHLKDGTVNETNES